MYANDDGDEDHYSCYNLLSVVFLPTTIRPSRCHLLFAACYTSLAYYYGDVGENGIIPRTSNRIDVCLYAYADAHMYYVHSHSHMYIYIYIDIVYTYIHTHTYAVHIHKCMYPSIPTCLPACFLPSVPLSFLPSFLRQTSTRTCPHVSTKMHTK